MAANEAEPPKSNSNHAQTTRPSLILPPRPSMDSLFLGGLGMSPGPMTLVSNFFSDYPDGADHRSFSQLLAGAMASPVARPPFSAADNSSVDGGFKDGGEKDSGFKQSRPLNLAVARSPMFTVPPGLSPGGFLNSPGFFPLSPQSPFGISHQQALAHVTAQAALAQSQQMRMQVDYQPSSEPAPPAPEPLIRHPTLNPDEASQQISASTSMVESSDVSQSERKVQFSSGPMDKPGDDGYNWRKYGQKPIKGCEYPRSYYKCTHSNCPVKKKIERSGAGQITEIIYKGQHNHEMPQPRHGKGGGEINGNGNSQAKPNVSLEVVPGNMSNSGENVSSISVHTKNVESTVDVPGSSDSEGGGGDEGGRDGNDDEPNPKRRNTAVDTVVAQPHKTVTEPKIVLQTRSEVDLLDDGYRWRKYGQKVVKGNPHPRSYYKCTSPGCNVRKHVERASTDPKAVITTYEGKHNHDVPAARNSSHNIANAASQIKPQKPVAEKPQQQQHPFVLQLKEEQIRV